MAHGWGEKRLSAGVYRGQYEKDKRHGFGALNCVTFETAYLTNGRAGEWTFPDGSTSVSYWHFDSVVKSAFMPNQMRQEMQSAIRKAQISAVAAGCQESFEVHPDEVSEWRRLRESRVMEAKRQCAVELAITTNKVFLSAAFSGCASFLF
jgi:hypothetical protein